MKTLISLTIASYAFLLVLLNAGNAGNCSFYGRAFFYESGTYRMMWRTEIDIDGIVEVEYNEHLLDSTKKEIFERKVLKREEIQAICRVTAVRLRFLEHHLTI